ncbi:MAG TPA: ATP-binding protein [Terriglobales bacterium]|nr:ATP-binding protein [Terriglobales bacterium]
MMSLFRDLPIRRKFIWVNIATTAVALLLASIAFVAYDIVNFGQRLVRQQSTLAQIVGYNVTSALIFRDRESATQTLAALRAEPQVLAAGIFTPDGEAFASYARTPRYRITDLRTDETGDGYVYRADHLLVRRSMVVEGEVIGSVRLMANLEELTAGIIRHLGISVLVFLAAIALSFPVLVSLQRGLSGPIMELVDTARIVSEQKDYSVRATTAGEDELGLLVRTFNEMLGQIQKRDQELERARVEAETANRAKDEFLAVVSHELRTPLSPVLAWARMLRTGQLNQERSERALEVIERNVKSQAQLIEDLLDVSRIITGKLRLDVRPVDIANVVEAAVESVRPTADIRNIRIQVSIDPRLMTIAGDPERLKQVLWNLLSNALKFTPAGGHIEVHVQRVEDHVEISVTDSGKGIDPAFLPYVFDRFRQADSTSTRAHGGLGLGLSIVRHLVELHGGRARAQSAGEGHGSTFTVELPITPLQSIPAIDRPPVLDGTRDSKPAPPPISLSGLRVLAVDDDLDTLETLRVLLEQSGAEVRTAASAAMGLESLRSWLPDLLISDIGMPGEDGYSLIRHVRALPAEEGGAIPALALTAYARVEDRLQVLSAGFQMHVPKPLEPAELIAVVHSLAEWTPKPAKGA